MIIDAVKGVTKKWAKQRKAEERDISRLGRRREGLIRSCRTTIKDVAYEVMEAAYQKASSNGRYPAAARQIMYAARPEIQRRTGETLDDKYFTTTLLPEYLEEFPQKTASWNVAYDARGHFEEPHTKHVVPLGTLEVRKYLRDIDRHVVGGPTAGVTNGDRYPTRGPAHRYSAILFIEKEGFLPLFEAAKLAERYDLAIMSTKGMSVTASRLLVDKLGGAHKVLLLVLRDFDKAGFSIAGTLQRNTQRYRFVNKIRVIDLGLRLADVESWHLEAEDVHYRSDPGPNLRKNGATQAEVEFLCSGAEPWKGYVGRRVELNAFTSADLLAWIESKLKEHGVKKVVPDAATLEAAYRRSAEAMMINQQIERLADLAHQEAQNIKVPNDLGNLVREKLKDSERPWDAVVRELAAGRNL
jgi:hypothetical protein